MANDTGWVGVRNGHDGDNCNNFRDGDWVDRDDDDDEWCVSQIINKHVVS